MPTLKLEELSPFGRLAVELDGNFTALDRISGQLQRLDFESDSGLEHAAKLLKQFSDHAQEVTGKIAEFSGTLNAARERAEAAVRQVGERAPLIQQRRELQNQFREELRQVEEKVKAAYAAPASLRKTGDYSEEEKQRATAALQTLAQQLGGFVEEVQSIKARAGEMRFKLVQHDAENLLDALKSSQRKLRTAG